MSSINTVNIHIPVDPTDTHRLLRSFDGSLGPIKKLSFKLRLNEAKHVCNELERAAVMGELEPAEYLLLPALMPDRYVDYTIEFVNGQIRKGSCKAETIQFKLLDDLGEAAIVRYGDELIQAGLPNDVINKWREFRKLDKNLQDLLS